MGAYRDMALLRNGEKGAEQRLKSWKQIASFFGSDERTVKRWEATRGLPVRRIPGGAKPTVYAEVAELELWLKSAEPPPPVPPTRPASRRTWAFGTAAAVALVVAGGAGLSLRDRAAIASPAHHQPSQPVADLYFAGRYNFEHRSPESLNRAVQLFGEAIRRDPQYAEAYAGLANCHLMLREYAGVPDALAYPRARAAARRALALDDDLADAHAALAFVTFFYDQDFNTGLSGFQRAIALDGASPGAHHWYATALYHAGRVGDALAQINEAQRLEPQSQSILADKALILFSAGHAPESINLLRQMEAADPDYLSPHAYLAGIYLALRDYPAFLAEQLTTARLVGDPDRASIAAAAERGYGAGGAPAMFAAMLERQRALYAAGREHGFDLAATYALAGQRDAAMRTLAGAVRDRDPYLVGLRIDFRFAGLRQAPDFQRLALSVGGG
jgi:tetratricopeptide (TPR) repeat protein